METRGGISVDELNAAMKAFVVSVKKEPMITHVAEFMRFNFKGDPGEENASIYLNGFSTGFCYLALLIKNNQMSIQCLEIDDPEKS